MRWLLLIVLCVGIALPASASRTPLSRPASVHGVFIDYHPNRGVASMRVYRYGKKVGRHREWWPNGRPKLAATYGNDAYDGEYRTWYENGQPYEQRSFAEGREAGLQRVWTIEGELMLSYEVRNGRRYGFVNARPCVAVKEQS